MGTAQVVCDEELDILKKREEVIGTRYIGELGYLADNSLANDKGANCAYGYNCFQKDKGLPRWLGMKNWTS